ncbi:extracellular catalytic domain type 1 short-chain-length polyhydroxyalkanoate depolymerase [Pseudoxanthomonas wuyuanensis]|uniref:Esterase, PHB depolymerase family n=1 Tax=Pseudoxanthomonas wuyuanensis TaxID=1073196 RepID=A0A286CWZ0_9GAMM|nr:PHB depolymerase family esterase [Pseudoxanthomonas wuyuanensis]SOD50898.1 esterase, PHB depolymerase family [Pseudoxanthomonas wuyuanensis]
MTQPLSAAYHRRCASAPTAFVVRCRRRILRWFGCPAILLILLGTAAPVLAQTEVTGFGSNPGNLRMFKYVPPGLPAGAPLVVALHGCAQSASSYDAETGWQMLADRWRFTLLLPQQQSGNNSSSCFNWFETADTARGQGEPLSIKQMVDRMKADHGSDASRIYVTGLSAGGAMAAVMMATYPDVFAGGAIVAGLPYRCASSQSAAFGCMNPGSDLTPAQWGDKVRAASGHAGPWPTVSIWHGDADYVVRPANLTESMEQWTNVHGIDQTADASDTVAGYPHRVYKDAGGNPRVETFTITGMGHGTPVDPGSGESQCGSAGAYILDANICSSYYIGRFWGLDDLDGNAPTVVLTSPANGTNVSGSISLTATASDDIGVERVEFLLDGALLGTDTTAPYSLTWNSASTTDGAHVLHARAVDVADNVGTSAAVNVNVVNGGGGGTPLVLEFANEDANDGYVKANADGSAPAIGTLEPYSGLALGRGSDGKFNRSLLSFDTSALPDNATLLSATLTVGYRSAYGNPWGNPSGNTLVIDANHGCRGACAIETGDYAGTVSAEAVAQLQPFSGGSQTSNLFSGAGLNAINRTGRTQLRLRFSANPAATHYLWIGNGASAKLRVEYLP